MAEKPNLKLLAKELYLKGFNIERIAEILNKTPKTIKNYKTAQGDWDELKVQKYLSQSDIERENIYQNFIEEMRLAVKDIRESELSAAKKADALSKIGDSFVKMTKVASYENPRAYKLSIAKKVIMLVVDKFKDDENKECIKKLISLIESEKFIKAIEELDILRVKMLFSKDELESFLLDTKDKLTNLGVNEPELSKLTRREFTSWLDELKDELKEQISKDVTLDPKLKDERIKRAEHDFIYFAKTYFPHYFSIGGSCALHEHLSDIFKTITTNEKGDKFCVAAPRGHAKTTYCSQLLPLWCICFNKKRFIVEISDAVELVEGCLEAIKVELEDNANLKADFPHVCGMSKNWKIGEFITKNGVKLKAFGSGKRLRGVKYGTYRPDLVVLDDLENDTNVRSKEQRDKLEAWLDEAVLNLGSVDGSLDVLYIGTILHSDSVLSRKLKLKFWNAKRYQSITQYPRRMDLWEEWANLYRNVSREASDKFYLKNKAKMDEDSVVLWDEALPILRLMQKRAENLKSFNKEQQNDPRSETQIFTKENIHFYKELPRCDYYIMYIDPAGEKKKSDYTAITMLGVDKKEAVIYVAESIVEVMKTKKAIKEIIRLNELYRPRICAIESNGRQEFFRKWIREKAFEMGVKMPLKGVNNTANKGLRIEELEVPIDDGEILLHKSQTLLIEQLTEYPEAKHDDAPDSLAGAYNLTKMSKKYRGGDCEISKYF